MFNIYMYWERNPLSNKQAHQDDSEQSKMSWAVRKITDRINNHRFSERNCQNSIEILLIRVSISCIDNNNSKTVYFSVLRNEIVFLNIIKANAMFNAFVSFLGICSLLRTQKKWKGPYPVDDLSHSYRKRMGQFF